jgi:hypothetical protein
MIKKSAKKTTLSAKFSSKDSKTICSTANCASFKEIYCQIETFDKF